MNLFQESDGDISTKQKQQILDFRESREDLVDFPTPTCLHSQHPQQRKTAIVLDIFQTVYKVAKVVHRNRSDNHCNQANTLPSMVTTTTTRALY